MEDLDLLPEEELMLEFLEQAWLCSDECLRSEEEDRQDWMDAQRESIPDHCGYNY